MFRPLATSALALILGAGSALADVTPAEVWESLEKAYTDMGYEVEVGSREESGGTLRLQDVVFGGSPGGPSTFSMTFPAVVLNDVGDGTVRSVIEGDVTMTSRSPAGPDGEEGGFDATMQIPGNETVSSGTPEDMRHQYVMPELRLTGNAVTPQGESPLAMTMTDVQGDQTFRRPEAGGNSQTYDIRAAGMTLEVVGEGPVDAPQPAPEGEAPEGADAPQAEAGAIDRTEVTLSISDLALTGTGETPAGEIDFEAQPADALRAGLSMDGRLTTGAVNADLRTSRSGDGPETGGGGSFTAENGEMAFAMSDTGITFEGTTRNMQAEGSGDQMPVPFSYAIATASGSLTMPLLQSDEPQPFALTYALDGVTLGDELWASFDPESQLPRDPASLNVDLSGDAIVARDLVDPEMPEDPELQVLQPRNLSVNALSLNGLGATADMSGTLTFGDDPTQPVGTLSGEFSGINRLLDTMVAMGVLPQEQLMGTRMMLAMFARPVEGQEDRLQTELEFREGGSIFANGQQVQ